MADSQPPAPAAAAAAAAATPADAAAPAAAAPAPSAGSSGVSALSRAIGPIRHPKASFRLNLPAWSAAPAAPFDATFCEVYETVGVILERKYMSTDGARGHSFGRHAEWCDIVLPKISSISRQHAALVHTRTGPVLLDLFSQHGTTLNGAKLTPGHPYALHEGDVARFGGAGSFYKFKGTGRPKREASDAVTPIVPPAGYKPEPAAGETDAGAAGASTAAASASSSSSGASASTGDKRKHEGDSSSRKDPRGESGTRPGRDRDSGGGGSGLPSPKTDRVRCRHLLVKHTKSRRPASWRADPVTLTLAEARSKLEGLRAQITSGNPSPSELESRFTALAKVESDCSSAKMGGDLGFFTFPKMQQAFSTAAFKLRVGELSPLVETDSGVHIIWRKE